MCSKGCLDFHALCWSPPHGGASEHHRVAGPLPEAAPLVDGAYGHGPQGHRRPAGVRAEAVVAATVHVLAIPAGPAARGGRWTGGRCTVNTASRFLGRWPQVLPKHSMTFP